MIKNNMNHLEAITWMSKNKKNICRPDIRGDKSEYCIMDFKLMRSEHKDGQISWERSYLDMSICEWVKARETLKKGTWYQYTVLEELTDPEADYKHVFRENTYITNMLTPFKRGTVLKLQSMLVEEGTTAVNIYSMFNNPTIVKELEVAQHG